MPLSGLSERSAAHEVLCLLINLGGSATKASLLATMPTKYLSRDRFRKQITLSLEQRGYVIADRYSLKATQAGKDHVADYMERITPIEQVSAGAVAGPRIAPHNRPFDFNKHYGSGPRRDGANDHRNIPSLMANQRIIPGMRAAK